MRRSLGRWSLGPGSLVVLGVLCCALEAVQERSARIVSLIPAVTEMLFAIGAGSQVVGVSSFDEYPPEVLTIDRVGALLDPDLERILALKPNLVIVYASQADLRRQLDRAGVPTYTYRHAGLPDISTTIRDIGARVGRSGEAARLTADIERKMAGIRSQTAGRPKPRTLVVFGRESGAIRGVYASGGVGFLHDMLVAAGGDNVFADLRHESVQATSELILARQPDVILELRGGGIDPARQATELDAWRRLTSLPAVRTNRLYFITDPRTVVPGPRVAEGTELIARALHPEAFR